MAYIGKYGQLIRLYPISSEEISTPDSVSFKTTMGGRVVAQPGPRGRRSWAVGYDSVFPQDSSVIEAFRLGAMGRPPWVWIPPDAMSVNALTPNESLLHSSVVGANVVPGPPREATDGSYSVSTVTIPAGQLTYITERERANGAARGVPVVSGELYTISAYGAGVGGTLRALFRSASGSFLATASVSFGADYARRSISFRAPAGATNVLLEAAAPSGSVLSLGSPAVTWTAEAQPWATGRGCHQVMVESSADAIKKAIRGRADHNRSAYSFVVRELG